MLLPTARAGLDSAMRTRYSYEQQLTAIPTGVAERHRERGVAWPAKPVLTLFVLSAVSMHNTTTASAERLHFP
jgi:hypothetical protein